MVIEKLELEKSIQIDRLLRAQDASQANGAGQTQNSSPVRPVKDQDHLLQLVVQAGFVRALDEIYLSDAAVPYLILEPATSAADATNFDELCEFCLSAGLGIALRANGIHTQKNTADGNRSLTLLSFGRLWTYRVYGSFNGNPLNSEKSKFVQEVKATFPDQRRLSVTSITEEFMPWFAARTLHRYLEPICQDVPKGAIVTDTGSKHLRSLVLNLPHDAVQESERQLLYQFVRELLPANIPLLTFPEDHPIHQQLKPLRPN